METKKILVVDDHEIVLQGISKMLGDGGYDVVKSTNANQALTLLAHVDDICLLMCDLSLPTVARGMELIGEARRINPQLPVIVFTMHEELWTIKALMDMGIDGIVLKGDHQRTAMRCVECPWRRKVFQREILQASQ